MAVPFGLLTAFGRPDLGLQMGAGAFLAIYFANAAAGERLKALPPVAALLWLSAACGVLLTPWLWVWAVGLVLLATLLSMWVFGYRLGPPGSVFFVLVYGLAANATAVVDGERLTEPWVFLGTYACGLAFSYLVSIAPLVRPSVRRQKTRTLRQLFPGPWLGVGEWELVTRVAIAATIATTICVFFADPHRAYWAVASGLAIIALRHIGRTYTFGRGLHRMVGTLIGAGLFTLIAPLGENAWVLVAILGVFQFIIELLVVRNYAMALVFITPLVLFIIGSMSPGLQLMDSVGERVIDTVIGVVVALAVVLTVRVRPRAEPAH